MKIAQVTPYDVAHPGGVGQHIFHLQREFESQGHKVVVIAPRSSKGGLEVRDGFYGVGRTISIPANGSQARLTFDVTLYNAVKQLLEYERFDVVHVHEPLTPLLPYMVLPNSNAANIATFHAARATNPWYSMLKPYFSFLLGRLDSRICVSRPAEEVVHQYFGGRYQIIPNGIDIEHYRPDVQPFPWATDGVPRILFVGRFNEQRKGFKYLLRAFPLIRQQFPETRLLVVGPGDRSKFQELINRYHIEGVDFIGEVPSGDLPHYYASCDVFIAPAVRGESFGLVLLEAMASGKPVVASNIPGYAGVVTHRQDGLLVPPKDSTSIALAIVRMLSDSALRRALSSRALVTAQQYAWPAVAGQILDVYNHCLSSSSSTAVAL